jgi:hypothetical protein
MATPKIFSYDCNSYANSVNRKNKLLALTGKIVIMSQDIFGVHGIMADKKKLFTATKITCSKCSKEYYVSFFADGHRNYFCEECLKTMHHNRKKGSIKKVFDKKKKTDVYEFICDYCDCFRRAVYMPARIDGNICCKECLAKKKLEDRKKSRKNIVIGKGSDS